MAQADQTSDVKVEISGSATVFGPVVGVNTGTITNIVHAARVVTSLHQLRAPLADFIGRANEITMLLSALRPSPSGTETGSQHTTPLCAICGMGGLGKTELALQVADDLRSDYPDAQLSISMRGSTTGPGRSVADGLRDAIRAFDPFALLPDDIDGLSALYRGYLSGKRALVLLDDVGNSQSVRPFLPPAGCALLVTSRTRLSLGGQLTILNLALLPRDESHVLLRSFVADRLDQALLDKLLDYCDDLPLALRVVGATLADDDTLSPERYLMRLADEARRMKTLIHEDVDVYAILGVGDNLLFEADPALAVRWRMLGVCPAPFEAATASAIWDEQDQDTLEDGLAQLVRRSLVSYDRVTGQYHIHDLLRDIARVRRTAEDESRARLCHAAYYLAIAREADRTYQHGGAGALAALALFDASWSHIRAAANWVATTNSPETDSLCVYAPENISILDIRLQPQELTTWCTAAVGAAERRGNHRDQATALLGMGKAAYLVGEAEQAESHYQQALAIYRHLEDQHGEGEALLGLGEAWQLIGKWKEAEEVYRRSLRLLDQAGDLTAKAQCQTAIGVLLGNTQSYQDALEWLEGAKAEFERLGDSLGVSRVLDHLSLIYRELGNYSQARDCAEQQLKIATAHGDQIRISTAYHNIGIMYWPEGEYDRALTYLQQALDIANSIGYRTGMILVSGDTAGVYAEQGNYSQAMEYLKQALDTAIDIGYVEVIGVLIGNAGELYRQRGEIDHALKCYTYGLQTAVELGDWPYILDTIGNIANILTVQEQHHKAEQVFLRAVELARELSIPESLCEFLQHTAELHIHRHHYEQALQFNLEAFEIAARLGLKQLLFQSEVRSITLRVALGLANAVESIGKLEALLEVWNEPDQQAAIYYEIWCLDPMLEEVRQQASVRYGQLYARTANVEYRERYQELTGEQLPAPAPLPSLGESLTNSLASLDTLLAKVGVQLDP
jgi:tetratricopeptide (TPR) repeat protein